MCEFGNIVEQSLGKQCINSYNLCALGRATDSEARLVLSLHDLLLWPVL